MNLFQAANGAAAFLIFSSLVSGLAHRLSSVKGNPVCYLRGHHDLLLLGLFITIFRIKTLLDDHQYFGERRQDKILWRYLAFIVAIMSWLFWAMSAYLLSSTDKSAELMVVAIAISSFWIVLHLIEIWTNKERRAEGQWKEVLRVNWLLFNGGYALCLLGYCGLFQPVVAFESIWALIVLLVLLTFDMLTCQSFRGTTKSAPAPTIDRDVQGV